LALIRTNVTIPLGKVDAQAILLNREHDLPVGKDVTMYGFGFGSNGTLKEAALKVHNLTQCWESWAETVVMEMEFCTDSDRSDAGDGDSGGPVVFQYKDHQHFLSGVVARGLDQKFANQTDPRQLPGIHTDIRQHIRWIVRTINSTETDQTDYLYARILNNSFGVEFDDWTDKRVYRGAILTTYNKEVLYNDERVWETVLQTGAFVISIVAVVGSTYYLLKRFLLNDLLS